MKIKQTPFSPLIATICNIALAYIVYMACRIAYVWENWTLFSSGWESLCFWSLLRGSVRFDGSAIFYTNALYIIMMLLPLFAKERRWWQSLTKCFFVVINSLSVAINLCDAVYSQFTGRRTTSTFFHEFSNENNLVSIFFTELVNHWYLLFTAIMLIAFLWFFYTKPDGCMRSTDRKKYRVVQSIAFSFAIPVMLIAMRGGVIDTYRPVSLADANKYVNQPHETAIVLNTPFTLIRTIGKTTYVDPHYFDDATLENTYSPLHLPSDTTAMKRKNIVILIVESFGREYIGYYNNHLEEGRYRGYTPFVDSLLKHSLTWEHTFANGRKSIDALPSILASIPMFVEPFYFTSYSLNKVSGLPGELHKEGYSSAFFHGAENGSMGFQAAARSIGFDKYYGRNEYEADPRFGGSDDFDGTWAIWDEPFLQYYATKMSEMQEPFVTAVFTASSHHPFAIPEEYRDIYPEEELVMHKCIRYVDNALRKFFITAQKQPWYNNSIFVLCSDHTNMSNHDIYQTPIGVFSAPILIYDPSGELPTGIFPGIAQQIDIMPTLLHIMGYPRPYIAFGNELLNISPENSWSVNYNGSLYQFLQNDTLIQFDGLNKVTGYDISKDPLLKSPIHNADYNSLSTLKAIIQQYMKRMIEDRLTTNDKENTL
ncbi:MAG: sulfatase-like hydrolase/transferase [Bacteroidales bacterium]|nr:sulfatase-like hydrolase/transferase [Bacteroidales bacterium]